MPLTFSSNDRFQLKMKYGRQSYEKYIRQYGRNSGRKDLLTKILIGEQEGGPLTDRETYTEIGNLVFAGTGKLPVSRRRWHKSDLLRYNQFHADLSVLGARQEP